MVWKTALQGTATTGNDAQSDLASRNKGPAAFASDSVSFFRIVWFAYLAKNSPSCGRTGGRSLALALRENYCRLSLDAGPHRNSADFCAGAGQGSLWRNLGALGVHIAPSVLAAGLGAGSVRRFRGAAKSNFAAILFPMPRPVLTIKPIPVCHPPDCAGGEAAVRKRPR